MFVIWLFFLGQYLHETGSKSEAFVLVVILKREKTLRERGDTEGERRAKLCPREW